MFTKTAIALSFGLCALAVHGVSPAAGQTSREPVANAPTNQQAPGATAETEGIAGSGTAVLDLLAIVPDTTSVRSGIPLVAYADLDAVADAASMRPRLDDSDILLGYRRLRTGPQWYLQALPFAWDRLPDFIGVAPADVARGLAFGQPPDFGMILGLNPGTGRTAAIGTAFESRGFDRRDLQGVPVWHRLEDGEFRLDMREIEDPFFGEMGRSARVAVFDDALAGSPVWSIAEAMVAARVGTGASLADDPAIRGAVAAVAEPDSDAGLLQFVLIDGDDIMAAPPDLSDLMSGGDFPPDLFPASPDAGGGLPPYQMAVLADRFTDRADEVVIAVVYDDAAHAETGAAALADRLRRFRPPTRPAVWTEALDRLEASIVSDVVVEGDVAIARVRISYAAETLIGAAPSGDPPIGGSLFALLYQALLTRELTPLMVFD